MGQSRTRFGLRALAAREPDGGLSSPHEIGVVAMATPPTGTLTFLFTDIEGSTRRWDEQPEAMQAALARHDALLREAIERHGGYIFKTVGDAFHAAFATAAHALAAAVEGQRALADEPWDGVGPVKVRMALHT